MAAEVKKEIELEIAHVLFTDIVGYSKLPVTEQRALIDQLNEIVRQVAVVNLGPETFCNPERLLCR